MIDLTIREAGDRLRRRSLSAVELVEATLRRIEQTEPLVHAYATVLADSARKEAGQADRELAQGHWRGPLHGIPIGVKDICYAKDVLTEGGSRALAGFVPVYDATVVRRLRDAGAILVGKTVTHEFAFGANIPPTRSPWSLECYSGGSSAGSGVAVSVRSAFGGIGTDTGGSIRIPAAHNGIVGLKPTFGRVSRYGVIPLGSSLDHVGPMTRTVEDCAIMLQAIAGHDPYDSGSIDEPVPDFRAEVEAGVKGLVIGVERDYHFYPGVTDDVRTAVENAIAELGKLGATVVDVKMSGFELGPAIGVTIMLSEASAFHRRLLRQRAVDYDQATRLMAELGELIPATHYLTAQRARALLRNTLKNIFKAHRLDAMLWPTTPMTTVPYDDWNTERRDRPGETPKLAYRHHTFSATVLGQPALSVPCGLSSAGLPMGLQLLGRPFDEATIFRIARAYEREHAWPTLKPRLLRAGKVRNP